MTRQAFLARLREGLRGLPAQTVADIMTADVVTCGPGDDVDEVAGVMTARRVRHMPVVDGATLVGIVSIGDVVKHRVGEVESESEAMRDYIRTA